MHRTAHHLRELHLRKQGQLFRVLKCSFGGRKEKSPSRGQEAYIVLSMDLPRQEKPKPRAGPVCRRPDPPSGSHTPSRPPRTSGWRRRWRRLPRQENPTKWRRPFEPRRDRALPRTPAHARASARCFRPSASPEPGDQSRGRTQMAAPASAPNRPDTGAGPAGDGGARRRLARPQPGLANPHPGRGRASEGLGTQPLPSSWSVVSTPKEYLVQRPGEVPCFGGVGHDLHVHPKLLEE
nr:serine/arginine repetitive matrix protein 3-like [Manis javanica]XP_036851434.1 serine/arginine repetitive matrix protein 3-like [Manis javanica]